MPVRTSVTNPSQTSTKHMVLCCGRVTLLFLAIVGFGLLQRVQAAESILPNHQVPAAPTETQPKPAASHGKLPLSLEAGHAQIKPWGPVDPPTGRGLVALAGPINAGAQASALPPTPDPGQGEWVALRGNTRPEAKAINDRGRVSDDLMLDHMMLQLQRTPEQEQSLQQFIKNIHDPASPLFHHWITAAEFGERYGARSATVNRVTDWLESQGFKVNLVYPNRMVIDFTGSAGQIRRALRTEIHNLQVNGQAHVANMSDPQIPAALASTVAGVTSLNDFRPHPTLHPRAKYTVGDGYDVVVPADLATIYNFNPAFAAGISGQGQTIVLIEDTDVYSTADWNTFRSTFGLATAYPLGSLAQVHPPSSPTNNCTDPGYNGDDIEARAGADVRFLMSATWTCRLR